jgi:uncharacterized protein YqeY
MPILETLRNEMFLARKNGEVDKANILGMAIASASNFKIEVQRDLTDEDLVMLLRKEEKKLKEAYTQFKENGRADLASKEQLQLSVIQSFLPKLMSTEEIEKYVKEKLDEMGEVNVRDMGKIIGMMMGQLKGKADGSEVSNAVKKLISSN